VCLQSNWEGEEKRKGSCNERFVFSEDSLEHGRKVHVWPAGKTRVLGFDSFERVCTRGRNDAWEGLGSRILYC
jgi:hypothetical protein